MLNFGPLAFNFIMSLELQKLILKCKPSQIFDKEDFINESGSGRLLQKVWVGINEPNCFISLALRVKPNQATSANIINLPTKDRCYNLPLVMT